MDIICLVCNLFVVSSAVFGLWCIFRFFVLDFGFGKHIRLSVSISSSEDLEKSEEIFFEADRSPFFAGGRYAVLLEDESLMPDIISNQTLNARADVYLRAKISKKE